MLFGHHERSMEARAESPKPGSEGVSSKPNYLYLTQADHGLVIAPLFGIPKVLGPESLDLAKFASSAKSIGVIVDADDVGVTARRDQVRNHFGASIPVARSVEPGRVSRPAPNDNDKRAFGLWVAPNCQDHGQLDDVIRMAANTMHPGLTPIADKFVTDLGNAAHHDWANYREKAVLGSLGQLWRASGSLASALQEREKWITAPMCANGEFAGILAFMTELLR